MQLALRQRRPCTMLAKFSLRTLLTLPYVLLVLLLAAIVGLLSYRAGSGAVDNLSGQLLTETVRRIAQSVDRHVAGSAAVLDAAFPEGVHAPTDVSSDVALLRTRFWLATSVHRDPNNYAYYGDRQGRFFGLWRYSASEAELRIRDTGAGPRSIFRFSGIDGTLSAPTKENRIFDPRERPWYAAAQSSARAVWTSVYLDFKTNELVATRTRRVNNAQGEFEGVVATDLSLQQVNAFLQRLAVSANSLAMVTEADGQLIGVSRGPHLRSDGASGNVRLSADKSGDAMVAATYRAVQPLLASTTDTLPHTASYTDADGRLVQVGYARLRDAAGLDWLIFIAVPRADFLSHVERNVYSTLALSILAAALVIGVGLLVLNVVTRELRRLADAAKRVGDGQPGEMIRTERADELGDLARSFDDMQSRLLTDQLTGLSNREAVLRRIEERILQHRRRGDARPFAVLFADFNRFKQINDRYGHDVGDEVLREMAVRLRQGVRASDVVARYAGDEFLILLEAVDSHRDVEAARRHLDQILRQPLQSLAKLAPAAPDDGQAFSGAAIGAALFPDDGQDVASLIKHADEDMYRRKAQEVG
jgi:diguanylate cyclase (GGDEF)-like protein